MVITIKKDTDIKEIDRILSGLQPHKAFKS